MRGCGSDGTSAEEAATSRGRDGRTERALRLLLRSRRESERARGDERAARVRVRAELSGVDCGCELKVTPGACLL